MGRKWMRWWGLLLALGTLYFAVDFVRRRMRARQLANSSQRRVGQVRVADVIDRELQDELWREELSAQLPMAVRYYDRRRYEIVRSLMPKNPAGTRFLDAGCGDGYVLQETAKHFRHNPPAWFGTDISPYKAERASVRLRAVAQIAVANVEGLPFADGSFDTIVCTEVMEHLLRVENGIGELLRVCRPGGRVILSTPSKHAVFFSFANPFTWLEAVVGLYLPALLPPFHNLEHPEDPESVVHRAFTYAEIKKQLRGFEAVSIESFNFRLPGIFYRWIRSPRQLTQIEAFFAAIPIVNRLGETLVVCAVKK